MAKEDLVPFNELTVEEQKKIASKGGKASVEARRKKKTMQETLEMILKLTMKDGDATDPETIKSLADISKANLTVDQAILLAQTKKAMKGDTQAATFIRDTSGNKPMDKVEHSGSVPVVIDNDIKE